MEENLKKHQPKSHLAINYTALPLVISLVIMVTFDQLSWERQRGIQFFALIIAVLVGLMVLTIFEKKRVPWQSYLLLVPIIFGASMTIIHIAPVTTFFNILLTLYALFLLAITLLNGSWVHYRIREVLMGLLLLIQSALIDPIRVHIKEKDTPVNLPVTEKREGWRKLMPYLRGLLIAIPLLLVFGALLASADLIFKTGLTNLFSWFTVENFADLIFRAIYICILAYFLAGAYIHGLTRTAEKKVPNSDKPLLSPFLGHVEAFTVLGLVNLLFLGFIIIQFRYFFAGETNITLEGFTYAEYARRGFFELVAVSMISLGLYYTLNMVTRRIDHKIKRVFSTLGALLMLQVGCMLVSAFQRLSLYETAYGFTTLRTITHIFMIWLGVLLVAAVLMEVFNQFRRLALVLFLVLLGFTFSLNLLNVDQFIAQRNVEHAIAGNPLDASYLVHQLSEDGLPTLFKYWQSQSTPQDVQDALHATLACRYAMRTNQQEREGWPEWHNSAVRADALLERSQSDLVTYPFIERVETYFYYEDGQEVEGISKSYSISIQGEEVWCMANEGH
ncbi:MAG: DUF4173 domain-containing protein [Brevefilum sp.]|nr:DUF4173 domain-containing protein [Brevefilum sp.]